MSWSNRSVSPTLCVAALMSLVVLGACTDRGPTLPSIRASNNSVGFPAELFDALIDGRVGPRSVQAPSTTSDISAATQSVGETDRFDQLMTTSNDRDTSRSLPPGYRRATWGQSNGLTVTGQLV